MQNKLVMAVLISLVAGGAGGFFAGTKYQQTKSPTGRFANFQGGSGGNQRNGQGRFNQGSRPVNGEIIAADDKSITVKLTDGSSKIVLFTDKTAYSKSQEGSKSDLKTGDRVLVIGSDNSDGSVTATNIQINPINPNFMFGAKPSPQAQ